MRAVLLCAVASIYGFSANMALAEPIVAVARNAPSSNVIVLPANTEVQLIMNEDLTTKGGFLEVGDRFFLSVAQDVVLDDYIVIPRGARAVGEVTWKTGKAAFGKSGKMEVALRYIQIGRNRIEITGKHRQEGEGNTVATIATSVLVAPVFGALVTGKSARIAQGREFTAFTANDVTVQLPTQGVAQQGIVARPANALTATLANAAPPAPARLPSPVAPPAVIDIAAMN